MVNCRMKNFANANIHDSKKISAKEHNYSQL